MYPYKFNWFFRGGLNTRAMVTQLQPQYKNTIKIDNIAKNHFILVTQPANHTRSLREHTEREISDPFRCEIITSL